MEPEHDIGWAIAQLKHGLRPVRRPHWGPGFYVKLEFVGYSRGTAELLLMNFPDGHVQPFTCHHDDLLATDWELAP